MAEPGSGRRFMADQVIGYFQDMAAYVLETCAHLPEPPHPEVQQEVLRRAVLPGNAAEKPEICLLDDHFKALAVGGHVRLAHTPRPLLLWQTTLPGCIMGTRMGITKASSHSRSEDT